MVFLDFLLLPSLARLATSYWRAWAVHHVFFVWGEDTDSDAPGGRGRLAQVGWTVRDVGLTHCEAGGSTSGSWRLVVWYPPSRKAPSPAPLDPLPWFPIRLSVLDWIPALPVRACLAPADLLPVAAVVSLATNVVSGGRGSGVGAVHQWGLFPASDLTTPVLLSTVGSITGLGVRPLSWPELAALWDVPILISDRLSEASDVGLLRGFCLSAPAKVLFVGADVLLTTSFRGVLFFRETRPGRPPRRMRSSAWRGRELSQHTRHRLMYWSSRGTRRRQTVRQCQTTCGSTLSSAGTEGSITVRGISMHWVCLQRPRLGV